jgi:hypothetical protein
MYIPTIYCYLERVFTQKALCFTMLNEIKIKINYYFCYVTFFEKANFYK